MQAGHSVWVYDNLSRGHREAVPSGRLIEGSLIDCTKVKHVLRDYAIDVVMHFAAYAQVGESVFDPALYYSNNVVSTLSLLEAMRSTRVTNIVFSSTTAIYGNPTKLPITEDELYQPINPYGFTKLVIERALEDYSNAYGFGFAALRYFNASGAADNLGEDHYPETHLIPIILRVALGQQDCLTIFGDDYKTHDGTCIRDYIHVDDLGDAHVRAISHLQPGSKIQVNLGTGHGYSVYEIVEACRRVTGHPIPVKVGPRRVGDPDILVADSQLAKDVLGWTPKYTLDDIVRTAWNWHRSHPNGYTQ
jgi:UDP-glucose 4-epimerase